MSAPTWRSASKYHAVSCRQNYPDCAQGHASLREHRRAAELRLLERAGEIRGLREQVPFELLPKDSLFGRKVPAVRYVADFVYELSDDDGPRGQGCWHQIVEDCKGVQTPQFRLKARLLKAVHGMEIRLS